ncbi:GSK3-beta interaction protein [Aphelenchoides besseyi]|nr:GSK3-beta interaction protein [Aphelenchoides besseyi]
MDALRRSSIWRSVYSVPSSPPPSPENLTPFNDSLPDNPLIMSNPNCKCTCNHHYASPYSNDNGMHRIWSIPMLHKTSSLLILESGSQSRGESSLELEALAAVHQLSFAVQSISVSEMLPRTPELIFVNVTTLEGQPYCLELTHKGWRLASLRTDCMVGDFTRMELFTKYYDSIFDLMEVLSPGYKQVFNDKLAQRLRLLEAGENTDVIAPPSSFVNSPSMNSHGTECDSCDSPDSNLATQ